MDFETTKIDEEIRLAKDAEAAVAKYEEFMKDLKEDGITPTDEQTEEVRKKLSERDFSTLDSDLESLRQKLAPQTTTPPTTATPETTSPPQTEAPQETGLGIVATALFFSLLASRKRR